MHVKPGCNPATIPVLSFRDSSLGTQLAHLGVAINKLTAKAAVPVNMTG